MASEILQLALALTPAVAISLVINRVSMPWDKKKLPSERAELLVLLARDIKHVKSIMARNIVAVNAGRSCALSSLPLNNWRWIKTDQRLRKYADEPIFKTIISQFREWERA